MTPAEATAKLLEAAKSGKVGDAEAAIAAGADPNARDESQRTPLHWAAAKGHTHIARLLIDKGAEGNAKDQWQQTPLYPAAWNCHIDLARLLIEKGADVNARNDQQETPLHWAAKAGHADLARLLIEKGADPNAKDERQQTPLHWGTMKNHPDLARMLIEKGAGVNAMDEWQRTPLHYAATNGYTEVVELLAAAQRWHDYVTPLLDADRKLDAAQLVDQDGQPTEALKNLLPNDLFGDLGRPDFYRQGIDGLVLVFPHLPEAVQASIDLAPWRRAKALEANAAAGPEASAVERYSRRSRRTPSFDVTP
jgi:ankyrin repeat protein